ncbi:MAG: hypothetical protein O2960_08260 [Verrucomicrobia bacterium]|nr:hypothetical protein [Verrucomicrobiota bacterium]
MTVDDRRKAAWALGKLGARAQLAIPALIQALEDEEAGAWQTNGRRVLRDRVCAIAAGALGEMGPVAQDAVGPLMESARFGVGSALSALARIAPDRDDVFELLQEALMDQSKGRHASEYDYRLEAVWALDLLCEKQLKALHVVARVMSDPDRAVRDEAVKVMVNRRTGSSSAPIALALLREHLTKGTLSERANTAASLAMQGIKSDKVLAKGCRMKRFLIR